MSVPDVTIVGGGVVGSAIALRLAQAGARVSLLERASPGAEASGAAAGLLAPQLESEGPGPFLDLCLRSRAMYPAFAQELEQLSGIQINYLASGVLSVAMSEEGGPAMEATVAWQKAVGLRAELLEGAEALKLEPHLTPRVAVAIHFPDDHQVDNRLLMKALSAAAARAGARFQEGNVRRVLVEENRVIGVEVDGETLPSGTVVIAAGSWSGLIPGSRIPNYAVKPVRGQMVQLQTRVPLLRRAIICGDSYLVPRVDGRILAGSTFEFAGFEKQVTTAGLSKILSAALELCPGLSGLPVQEFWAGLRPYTEDQHPLLGEGPLGGLFWATGHFRNGILLAPITAQVVTQAILGQKTSVDLRPFGYARLQGEDQDLARQQ
jgi:glycine oxidase